MDTVVDLAEGDRVVGSVAGELLTEEIRILSHLCKASHQSIPAPLGRKDAFDLIDVQVEPGQDVAK